MLLLPCFNVAPILNLGGDIFNRLIINRLLSRILIILHTPAIKVKELIHDRGKFDVFYDVLRRDLNSLKHRFDERNNIATRHGATMHFVIHLTEMGNVC